MAKVEMGKYIHFANVKILIWKLVADGSSRGDVGMQIAISHEVCAVSRSCFFYYGKLQSVAGPVIQENGWLTVEDDLMSGGLLCFTTQ